MKWAVIGCCLASLFALCTTKSAGKAKKADADECTQANKVKSLYGGPKYSPELTDSPATSFYTTVKALEVSAGRSLREYGERGIYAATMMRTRQDNGDPGCGGYFGVQWKPKKGDELLFSIWDKKSEDGGGFSCTAFPMHDNCKRNCNDCGEKHRDEASEAGIDDASGTQCHFDTKEIKDGEEIKFTIEREAVGVTKYQGVEYFGHVWKITAEIGEDVITLGRILFTDDDLEEGEESRGGVVELSMFHEHLGCTPCGAFDFQVHRTGPYVMETAENTKLAKLVEMDANFGCNWKKMDCTCRVFDVKSDGNDGIIFMTGAEGLTPHWPVKEKVIIYKGGNEDNTPKKGKKGKNDKTPKKGQKGKKSKNPKKQ